MEGWAIGLAIGAFLTAFSKKLNTLIAIDIGWGLVRLKFALPRNVAKKPIESRVPRQLKQVRRISR